MEATPSAGSPAPPGRMPADAPVLPASSASSSNEMCSAASPAPAVGSHERDETAQTPRPPAGRSSRHVPSPSHGCDK
eukprot:scaffold13221_cov100-Isochrysis_galbana.AAC.7